MPTTSNFGWTTPADTDLVKDGAAAIRTLGNGIDTSFIDLKGGTTGQILAKASNTDLDFSWIANDQGDITAVTAGTGISGGGTTGAVTITNDMATTITAAGDIVVGTGNATYDNLPIGTTGQILTADTSVSPYKVKWATPTGTAFVGCILDDTGNQNIATATATALTYNAEIVDTDGFHSTSTNTSRITIPSGKGGKYIFIAHIQSGVYASGAGYTATRIYKNGASVSAMSVPNILNFNTDVMHIYIADAAVGDYFELFAFQNTGNTQTIYKRQADGPGMQFAAQFLG